MADSLSEQVYRRILAILTNGELPPGARLVNRELAKDLGVSAIPVREALQRLASEGLVEHVPGGGMYTRRMDHREIAQLYSFRQQLECYAVREAAQHIRDYQLRQLEACLERTRLLLGQLKGEPEDTIEPSLATQWIGLDAEFHELLIEAADNIWLTRTAKQIHLLHNVIRSKNGMLTLDDARQTLIQHEEIVAALGAGDGDGAHAAMADHIARARQWQLETITQR